MDILDLHAGFTEQLIAAIVPINSMLDATRTLSLGKIGILKLAAEHGQTTAAAMKERLGVSQQAISLAAKELVTLGYLSISKQDDDRRRTWFQLTEAGREKLNTERQCASEALNQVVQVNLSPAECQTIREAIPVLTKIWDGETK